MKKRLISVSLLLLIFLFPIEGQASNPVIKDRYSADPAALVHDGRVYLYTGQDEATSNDHFFVLKKWSIYSSDDMVNWEYEGSLDRTAFEWGIHDTAWASQAIERDGKFYWYTTVKNKSTEDPGYAIGVAVSDNPVEGFKDALGEPLITSSMTTIPEFMGDDPWNVIDPTVFIDQDGQAHLYWGNTHLYYAKLKDNMIEIDGEIKTIDIQNMEGTFTEGPFLHQYLDQYYLTFAYNYPEEIGYAISDSPEGPWEFKGKIMDRIPNSGTSHPAVIEFNDNWYFIYHNTALPGGGENNRSVAIEPLHYYDDGSIAKITPTASGVSQESYLIEPLDSDLALRQVTMAIRLDQVDDQQYDYRWYESESLASIGENYVSYQIDNSPGVYLTKTDDDQLKLEKNDGTIEFAERASFKKSEGLADSDAYSLQPYLNEELYLAIKDDGKTIALVNYDQIEDDKLATFSIEIADPIIPPAPDQASDEQGSEIKEEKQDESEEVKQSEFEENDDSASEQGHDSQLTLIIIILFAIIGLASYILLTKKAK
ncbi:family 43 glycosylhydrolase [Amphibacillus sp. MSJ-3]|uniref:family 43 glycosylhydrolase n=1 Tax=Amphibacillus sp. MSJ-3 TaxID=2841505 RepID=UPI001C0EEF55|nr:family 43 glycosylhydrolase [Amphibacillus sp. MSJ-3]MBU5594052.1 family 43 glycosylhydrolase [Amphibacillus sp. MSJ-3]